MVAEGAGEPQGGSMKRRKRKAEPGLRINHEPGLVTPVVIPPSREVTIIRVSRDANGCTVINAPRHVDIVKRDGRPGR